MEWIKNSLYWLGSNNVGDAVGVLGLIITIVGFILTIINIKRTKKIAVEARNAADKAVGAVNLYNELSDISSAISGMEEIIRKIHDGNFESIINNIMDVKKRLVSIKSSGNNINEDQRKLIQKTLSGLSNFSEQITNAKRNKEEVKVEGVNKKMMNHMDVLVNILVTMKSVQGGRI
jgi:hypothetical protein